MNLLGRWLDWLEERRVAHRIRERWSRQDICPTCRGPVRVAAGSSSYYAPAEGVGIGTEYVGPLGEYIAVNLREALEVIPDTGDWHALVRWACSKALEGGTVLTPNQTAEWYLEAIRRA